MMKATYLILFILTALCSTSSFQTSCHSNYNFNKFSSLLMTNTIERTIRNEAPINVILGSINILSFFQSKPNKENITWGAVFNQQIEKATWEYLNNKAYPSLINATFNVISLDSYTGDIPKSPIYVLIGIEDQYKGKIAQITHLANAVVVFESDKHIHSLERYGEN